MQDTVLIGAALATGTLIMIAYRLMIAKNERVRAELRQQEKMLQIREDVQAMLQKFERENEVMRRQNEMYEKFVLKICARLSIDPPAEVLDKEHIKQEIKIEKLNGSHHDYYATNCY